MMIWLTVLLCFVQVYADASIVFPLLVAETFAHNASRLIKEKKSD